MDANYQAWNEGSVLASEAGRVLTITLNRPERKNAMGERKNERTKGAT